MRKSVAALLLGLLWAGCTASTGGPQPTDRPAGDLVVHDPTGGTPVRLTLDRDPSNHRVRAPMSKSWSEIAHVYEALKITLEYADHRANRVGNTRFVVTRMLGGQPLSTYLRCGMGAAGALADSRRIRMNISTELKPAATDSTAVFTTIDASASPIDGTNSDTVPCTSTGALESTIVQMLRQRVGDVRRPPTGGLF